MKIARRSAPYAALVVVALVSPLRVAPAAAASNGKEKPTMTSNVPPAVDPETNRLDFWVGDWELDSHSRVAPDRDEWVDGHCSNRVRKILDGRAVQEEFDGRPAEDFRGTSLSIYDVHEKRWRQTWVDSTGSYMDFKGEWAGDRMIFAREVDRAGVKTIERMVFHDIRPDSLTWDWEKSTDGGKSFRLFWRLGYRRRK